jgi:hypothetical protein
VTMMLLGWVSSSNTVEAVSKELRLYYLGFPSQSRPIAPLRIEGRNLNIDDISFYVLP